MERLIIFGIFSFIALIASWRVLFTIKSHGFYRFFSWECIIWLFSYNYTFWFDDPFSIRQIFSWVLLLISIYLVAIGVLLIIRRGKASASREDKTLFSFEKTTRLVDTGIYKYIRHPIYSSMIYLTWGIFLKNIIFENFVFAVLSTVFLYITSRHDEMECTEFFGEEYKSYMKRSKMFIPFIF
jgi:protein-S-isoprenylcysteine O-methyltransferase Ste14